MRKALIFLFIFVAVAGFSLDKNDIKYLMIDFFIVLIEESAKAGVHYCSEVNSDFYDTIEMSVDESTQEIPQKEKERVKSEMIRIAFNYLSDEYLDFIPEDRKFKILNAFKNVIKSENYEQGSLFSMI